MREKCYVCTEVNQRTVYEELLTQMTNGCRFFFGVLHFGIMQWNKSICEVRKMFS